MNHLFSTKQIIIIFTIVFIYLFVCLFEKCTPLNSTNQNIDKKELGRYLFYDRRLSVNRVKSCATCHNQKLAFTDGYKRSLGAFADLVQRNTPATFNLSSYKFLTQADSSLHNTFTQMAIPLFNTTPIEMGVTNNEEIILDRVKNDKTYKKMFSQYFPKAANPITWTNIRIAISDFLNTIVSNNSPYDAYKNGDSSALTQAQKNGMKLFFSSKLKCAQCHGGNNFSSPSITNNKGDTVFYFNVGLYNVDGNGAYPAYDQGLFQVTKKENDKGCFRVPTLRNIEFTAPYFHDGSCESLSTVIDVFARGGREIDKGVDKGDGTKNKFKHPLLNGFIISSSEKIDLINFLYSLSDTTLIKNPAFSNPFAEDETEKNY